MKITRRQLRQIIKEEVERVIEVDTEVDTDVDLDVDKKIKMIKPDLIDADHEEKLKKLETKIGFDVIVLKKAFGMGRSPSNISSITTDKDNIDLILSYYTHNNDDRISKLLWAWESLRGNYGKWPLMSVLITHIGKEEIAQYPNIQAFVDLVKKERIPQSCLSKQILSIKKWNYLFGDCEVK